MNLEEFMKKNARELQTNCVLLIVCNTKSDTIIKDNYSDYSINSEFLSDDELKELTAMVTDLGIPFRIFYDEKDFMLNILTSDNLDRYIVYNSAQNGTGPGRKALIPSVCKFLSLRHTGSDAYRVCLCRDKYSVISILQSNNILVPRYSLYNGLPIMLNNSKYIAKPLYESASIGISNKNIFNGDDIPFEYLDSLIEKLKQPLLIQEFIDGYELEVPVLLGLNSVYAFPPVVIHSYADNLKMGTEILDYDRIYWDKYFFSSLPKDKDDTAIKTTAINVVKLLGLKGLCRVDFRLKTNGEFYVTDVSTNPHFINHSSINFAFKKEGKTDSDILKTILLLS